MKATEIKVSELEDYLKYKRMERDLAIELTHLKELTELKKRKLEKILPKVQLMKDLRNSIPKRYKSWEDDEEVKRILNKQGVMRLYE